MTSYVGRSLVALRRPDSHPSPHRAWSARREPPARAREAARNFSIRSPAGDPEPGGGWARRRALPGQDPGGFRIDPQILRLQRAHRIRPPNRGRREGASRKGGGASEATPAHREALMKLTGRSGIGAVAVEVANVLSSAGIEAVLTGSTCASIHTGGRFQSADLDFILQSGVHQAPLDAAMATAGFQRQGDRYVHSRARFYVEFPRGPLAIGSDHEIQPVETRIRGHVVHSLSPTDSCRDRLAAFLFWRDRQESSRSGHHRAPKSHRAGEGSEMVRSRGVPRGLRGISDGATESPKKPWRLTSTSASARASPAPRRTRTSSSGPSGPSGSRPGST